MRLFYLVHLTGKNPKKKRKKSKHTWKLEESESKLEVQNIIDAKEVTKMRSQLLANKSEFVPLERKREEEITKKKRLEERKNEYERSQRNIALSQTPITSSNILNPPVVATATASTQLSSFSKIPHPEHHFLSLNPTSSSSQNIIQNHKFNQYMPQTPVPPEQIFGKRFFILYFVIIVNTYIYPVL